MKTYLLLATLIVLGLCSYAQVANETQGTGSGISITSGDYNTLYGDSSGYSLTSGSNTTMIGYKAGKSHKTQFDNTFIGSYAGEFAISGTDNVFIGKWAGRYCDGTDNTIIGTEAGMSMVSGASDNTIIGEEAGQALTDGDDNVFIGEDAGFNSTTSSDNTFVGNTSGRSNTTGFRNAFFGNEAGYDNTTGYWNTGIGDSSLIDCGVGFANTTLGHGAGAATEYADNNTFIGTYAGGDNNRTNNTSNANRNTYLGSHAGHANREGSDNVGIGAFANFGNNNRSRCIFMGSGGAGYDNTGFYGGFNMVNANDVIVIGYKSYNNAQYSTGIGHLLNQHGIYSVGMGYNTHTESAGDYGVLVGSLAYMDKAYGVGLGHETSISGIRSIGIGAKTTVTADSSIVIGAESAISGANSIALGFGSNVSGNYSVVIGSGATTAQNNSLVLGGLTAMDRVSVGIGTSAPNQAASLELAETNKGFLVNRLTSALRTSLGSALTVTEKGMMVFDTDENTLYTWDGSLWNSSSNTDAQNLDLAGNILSLSNDATTVDLSAYLDNTDTQLTEAEVDAFADNNGYLTSFTEADGDVTNEIQDINLTGSDLSISSGSTIDMSSFLDNTDTQLTEAEVDAFTENNGYLTTFIEVDGDATNEIQDINLAGSDLSISSGSTIDMSSFLDNTDTQLTEAEVDAFTDNNGYLTSFTELDGDATNEIQDINLAGSDLSISDGSTIDMSSFLDNTDTQLTEAEVDAFVDNNGYLTSFTELDGDATNEIQDITLSGSSLSISGGSTVDLSAVTTNTDAQDLTSATLVGTTLEIEIENGNSVTVDLAPLFANIEAQLLDHETRLAAIEECACDGALDVPGVRSEAVEKAILYQNIPNPFNSTSVIKYYIPSFAKSANLVISNNKGQIIANNKLSENGDYGSEHINADGLAPGVYYYTLYVNQNLIDTKKMIVQ